MRASRVSLLVALSLVALLVAGVTTAATRVGTPGPDVLRGTDDDDLLLGKGGNDRLYGLDDDDRLYGGPGNDLLVGGDDEDRLYGGPGNDTILARDGDRDVIACGRGRDTARVDRSDVVSGCEQVSRRGGDDDDRDDDDRDDD